MLQKKEFLGYIKESNFYELFIESGWNNPQGDTNLGMVQDDDTSFCFEQIAERNGFKIVKCETAATPNSSQCKKIDHYLRRMANDYICIFYQPSGLHHLWLVPVNKVDKRDLVRVEYQTLDQASFLYEKVAGFSFELGSKTNIVDVREKVQKAFLVDSEKVTKKFYDEFKKQHKAFTAFITGIDDYIDEENKNRDKKEQVENKNKKWYASIMLNRLMFCYFIQRKRFLDGKTDYLNRKLQEVKEQEGDGQFYNFYRSFLIHLFHEGINAPRHDSPEFLRRYGRIPYLNGGLFGEHELETKYKDIDISDEAFEKLFAFFDQWNWHLDTSLTASGKDINPDVLGYIFEQYINDRAAMGAYYTKEDITEYIGRNTILPFLMDKVKTATQDSEKDFRKDGYVWKTLAQSGDKYIFDAVTKGYTADWQSRIPDYIANGIDTSAPNLLERRSRWNEKTSDEFALPTEIWRETVERLQRCDSLLKKITDGEITEINDFITYNLDIRQFVSDLLANAEDHRFIAHFYHALQKITILDPTCGSGAFLFAAMNILEPLYNICIEKMEDWHRANPNLFKEEIEEIDRKYRSNRQYFIYKSIILRNLYGVDIMVEATEIAKLRLFLKMVAVVEVDLRAENLGLDPLPDIDFNIRCGNTLVGYATEKELQKDLVEGDAYANAKFKKSIEDGMEKAAYAFKQFKVVQFKQEEDMEAFKNAKDELRKRLEALNNDLNHRLYASTTDETVLSFDEWKASHQPFHWLAEFYEITHGNGGFDVIIGNPPYVVYTKQDKVTKKSVADVYKLRNYKTNICNNLYAFTIERSLQLLSKTQRIGMIVPLSLTAAKNMQSLRIMLTKQKYLSVSSYEIRPGKLFDGNKGADQRLNIFISAASYQKEELFTTKVQRWASEHRKWLFPCLCFSHSIINERIWRFSSPIEFSIYNKYNKDISIGQYVTTQAKDPLIHYRSAGLRYWIIFLRKGFNTDSASNKEKHICNPNVADYLMAALNSNLFWWYYSTNFDMFNLTEANVFEFKINYDDKYNVGKYSLELEDDMDRNKSISIVNKSDGGTNQSFAYQKKLSKPIIDNIDKLLKSHYGFTEEELDFIINYDIKYRMGDELNEE